MPGKHHDLAFTKARLDRSNHAIHYLWRRSSRTPPTPTVDEPTGFFGALANAAEWFIGLFQAGGDFFLALVTGILPLLIVLLTAINALIRLIGPERIDKLGEYAARPGLQWYPVRYMVFPALSVFFLTNPMCYTMGRFLPERYKPAFYDSRRELRAPDHRHLPARQRR